MNQIAANFLKVEQEIAQLSDHKTQLIAVSKTKPNADLEQAYQSGCRVFGENKVQEMSGKHEALPKDIQWHLIGHLQSNKVKYITPFVSLIHSVDSLDLLKEIDKRSQKNGRITDCLLQIYIAQEETKFGLSQEELFELLENPLFTQLQSIRIKGLMGMASNTDNESQIGQEFRNLRLLFEKIKSQNYPNSDFKELSMGMSSDYKIAIQEGSTMVRIGSAIFGHR